MYCRNYTGTVGHVLCGEMLLYSCVFIWESPLSEFSLHVLTKCVLLYVHYASLCLRMYVLVSECL